MTTYVYKLPGQSPLGARIHPDPWFGLTADTEDELHAIAARLGLRRDMYRPRTVGAQQLPVVGHYDVTEGEHDQAVAFGAQPISSREHDKMQRRRAAEFGIQ